MKNINSGKQIMAKTKNLLLLLLIVLFTSGSKFYMPTQIKWSGERPVIQYNIFLSEGLISPLDYSVWYDEIHNTDIKLFQNSEAKIVLKFNNSGVANVNPFPIEYNSCPTSMTRQALVYTTGTEDPDCTSSSCVFLWSCELCSATNGQGACGATGSSNTISSASVQLNLRDYQWAFTDQPGFMNINREIMHDFGHVLGLNHCLPGEKNCTDDPVASSVMYKFTDSSSLSLSSDDVSGLQTLYGKLILPFDKTGKYALSAEELEALTGVMQLQSINSDGVGNQAFNEYTRGLTTFSEKESGKSLQVQTNEFFQEVIGGLNSATTEELLLVRKMNVAGIYIADQWIQDAANGAPIDLNVLQLAKSYHTMMRQTIINILETR